MPFNLRSRAVTAVVACTAAALAASALTTSVASAAPVATAAPAAVTAATAPATAPATTPAAPTTAPAASPSTSRSASPSAAPSAPTATVPTAAPSAATGTDDPTLAEMNAVGNHTMGSTIPVEQSPAPQLHARSLAANSAAVPGTDGLDISAWQPNSGINWTSVYNNGARFVYIKATESTTYKSSQFAAQYASASSKNIIRGAYHFAVPNKSSGATQAAYFTSNGGGWSADGRTLPPLLDIEYNPYSGTDHTNTCYGLSAASMVNWIRDFSNTVKARTGTLPAIYSTNDWWRTCTGNSNAFGANALFVARYPSNLASGAGTLPASWSRYTMWQYASSGVFPGDQDVFNGTLAALQSFARGPVAATPAKPAPKPAATPLSTAKSLTAGQTLTANKGIISPNKQYTVAVQADGNLVERQNGRPLWATNSSRYTGARTTLQRDGDLVVTNTAGTIVWRSGTAGKGIDNLIVTNYGDVRLRTGTTVVWSNGRPGADSMVPGTTLIAGQYLQSADMSRKLLLQPDGNLVLYRGAKALWATNTSRFPGATVVFQKDGNLVVRSGGTSVTGTDTAGKAVVSLTVENSGDMTMSSKSAVVWRTGTAGK